MRKGLICAGGNGTRLSPLTKTVNKHLVGILNQPMIIYPLMALKKMGITDILIVSGGDHIGGIAEFLDSGEKYGVNLMYCVQKEAGGIAQAVAMAELFAGDEELVVILGDNIFENNIVLHSNPGKNAHIFIKKLPEENAKRFGVLLPGDTQITEKPEYIPSDMGAVVTGLYVYPSDVFSIIKKQKPSERGELEITSINNFYLKENRCEIHEIEGFWSDAGTVESLKKTIDWAYEHGIK
jgi:glucose-1-phosphate thymidylyltransferase